ncbi:MAG: cupin domain-containing protein [bacterium]|nr:cupin domain-containing protein [bacterium]
MEYNAININEKFSKFTEHFSPKVVAEMNDYSFKLTKFKGDFVWHKHDDTDETFIVIEGEMQIDFRDGVVVLKTGEMFVVPKGIEHKPYAENECRIMLIEPTGVVNTGDAGGDMTAKDEWI